MVLSTPSLARRYALACLWLAPCACGADPTPRRDPAPTLVCDYGAPVVVGALDSAAPPKLNEASGLIQSRRDPNLFWSHNDDGDDGRLVALRADGTALGTWQVDRGDAADFEDLARGPHPEGGDYLYLGDIGGNEALWGTATQRVPRVLRVREPAVPADGSFVEVDDARVEVFELTLPEPLMTGRNQDMEAMFVDPTSGDLYLVTKRLIPALVLRARAPLSAEHGPLQLEEVGSIDVLFPTGADITADGALIAVRTYWEVHLWLRPPGTSIDEALRAEPCTVAAPVEPQGEAIALDAARFGAFFTVSERGDGPALIPIYEVAPVD